MKPILPVHPGMRIYSAGPFPWTERSISISGKEAEKRARRMSLEIPVTFFPYPMGIISMKRTSSILYSAREARGNHSSSFTSCCSTTLILVLRPESRAASMLSRTSLSMFLPVILSNFAGSRVSRLILTASRPAARSSGRYFFSSTPFVVIVTCSTPVTFFREAMRPAQPSRARGSPPVILIFRMPSRTAAAQVSTISS